MTVKVIDLTKEGILLPAKHGVCPECAVKHEPEQPHNQQSLYWQYKFYKGHGLFPTWKDALSHCTQEVKGYWISELSKYGIKVEGQTDGETE